MPLPTTRCAAIQPLWVGNPCRWQTIKHVRVYLDYAATTPLDPEVEAAMRPYHAMLGNAASVHREGSSAKEALEMAREQLAGVLGVLSQEIIFTSGGTEANNQVLFSVALSAGHIITTAVEHSAILAPLKALSNRLETTILEPDQYGMIHPEQVAAAIRPNTALISVQHVNNELGTIQPIGAIGAIAKAAKIPFHVDAVQTLGHVPLELPCDLLSLAAHKFYGPKGVGALWVSRDLERRGFVLSPLLFGGQQERGLRGGTHNLPGAMGMALAAQKAVQRQPAEAARLLGMRDWFAEQLLSLEDVTLNGHPTERSPRHVNITAHGADGEALLMNLDLEGVAASSGSACSAGTLEPSHVLLAIGKSTADAKASLRFSLGAATTPEELEFAVAAFSRALRRSR
jgi:cysteine desulfurase